MLISLGVFFPNLLGYVIFISSWYVSSKFLSGMMSPKPEQVIDNEPLERLMISILPRDPPPVSPFQTNPPTALMWRRRPRRKIGFDFQCKKLNLGANEEILKGCTAIGTSIGMVLGGIVGNMPGALIGGANGGILGASLGTIFFANQELYSKTEHVGCQIDKDNVYRRFKTEPEFQEEYFHFLNFFKTSIGCLPENLKAEIQTRLCDLTQTFPEIPVFLPHGHLKLQVYEKAALEQILTQKEKDIAEYAQSARNNGASQDEIKRRVDVLFKNDDLFFERYFTTSQLVYDPTYAKNMISLLQQIQDYLIENPSIEHSEAVCQGIRCLISHYQVQYNQVMITVTNKLGTEMLYRLADPSQGSDTLEGLCQANYITKQMQEMMIT
ncbi:MAG: glycine zipper family protein [Parachlamydiaceae bacterium]